MNPYLVMTFGLVFGVVLFFAEWTKVWRGARRQFGVQLSDAALVDLGGRAYRVFDPPPYRFDRWVWWWARLLWVKDARGTATFTTTGLHGQLIELRIYAVAASARR
jgi:hypothetical protein